VASGTSATLCFAANVIQAAQIAIWTAKTATTIHISREFLESQHVHHAYGRKTRAKQFRSLRHGGANQQSPVASTLNGQAGR
jgi:hypothetical protein